jgi:hypothetical protein
MNPPHLKIETIELQRELLRLCYRYDPRIDVSVSLEEMTEQLVIELRRNIWKKEHPKRNIYKYPSNWKESLKERFFPKWLLKKYPIDYDVLSVSLEEIYPDFEPSLPEHKHVAYVRVYKTTLPYHSYEE